MFLVIVGIHSKWLDMSRVLLSNTGITIEEVRASFAIQRLPKVLVTDNGPLFTSSIKEPSESEMDMAVVAALTPLPPEEQDEFLLSHSELKRQAT
eukprot:g35692.t1